MTTSHVRGNKVYWDGDCWRYFDGNERLTPGNHRKCPRCGNLPTKEGYDHCMGEIKGAVHACCGHGVSKRYVIK